MTEQVDLIARFACTEGSRPAVLGLLLEYAIHVRSAPGTLRFETYWDAAMPNQIFVLERYVDAVAFGDHLADPENERFNAKLAPLIDDTGVELIFLTHVMGETC